MNYLIKPIDKSSIRILYTNCCNEGYTTDRWFHSLVKQLITHISLVVESPAFILTKIDNDLIVTQQYRVRSMQFNSWEQLLGHFKIISKFQSIDLYSINQVEISNSNFVGLSNITTQYQYIARFTEILQKNEIRDLKIDYLLNKDN